MNQEAASGDYIHDEPLIASVSDRKLLAQIGRGDEAAFTELYHRYSVSLYNYILRLVHDTAAAEDILQEVFVGSWTSAAGFRGRSSVKTWMFRIAHHKTVSWLRRNVSKQIDFQEPEPGLDRDAEIIMQRNWRFEQLIVALDQLSPVHRATIELVYAHELSYREIAEVFDCPVGTVKSRLSYGLKHLNRLLMGQGMTE